MLLITITFNKIQLKLFHKVSILIAGFNAIYILNIISRLWTYILLQQLRENLRKQRCFSLLLCRHQIKILIHHKSLKRLQSRDGGWSLSCHFTCCSGDQRRGGDLRAVGGRRGGGLCLPRPRRPLPVLQPSLFRQGHP